MGCICSKKTTFDESESAPRPAKFSLSSAKASQGRGPQYRPMSNQRAEPIWNQGGRAGTMSRSSSPIKARKPVSRYKPPRCETVVDEAFRTTRS